MVLSIKRRDQVIKNIKMHILKYLIMESLMKLFDVRTEQSDFKVYM